MESGNKAGTRWLPIMIIIVIACPDVTHGEEVQEEDGKHDIMKNFIYIPAMRMGEYNFWWTTNNIEDCARYCLEEGRIYCKSFSYRENKPGCGTYENARDDAPPGMYNEPNNAKTDSGTYPSWRYYERKTKEYKILEEKMRRLENLTEISVGEATEVLSGFGTSLNNEPDDGSGDEFPVSPGELDLMSQMLQLVVNLNPIFEASAEVSESFAKVLVNVSDSMMKPTHKQSWKSLQRDPNATGIAGIVTSSEVVTRDVSERLLFYDNSTSIVAESENVGMWMDIVEFPDLESKLSDALALASFPNGTKSNTKDKADYGDKKGTFKIDHDSMYIFPTEGRSKKKNVREGRFTTDSPENPTDKVLAGDIIMVPRSALRNRSVVTHVRYKGLSDVIPSRNADVKQPKKGTTHRVNSAVLTTSVHPKPAKHVFQHEPVVIIFTHTSETKEDSAVTQATKSPDDVENSSASNFIGTTLPSTIATSLHCVYWEEGDSSYAGGWSKEGCELELSNDTHTICKCVHLTSFAVLLKMVDTSEEDESDLMHNLALSWISYIGCALSLGGVLVMCSAFIMLKFHTENMKIHFNLGVAVGAADLVFMFEELAQRKQYSCVLVTVLLYYFNMAVLSWMLIEGLFLYSQVVVVFVSARRWVKYYVYAGWGIPAVVMGISMGILNVQLGTNKICWLSPIDNSIWAFAAPAILVIIINFVILVSVVRVIVGIQPDQTNNVRISKVRNAVKGSIFLSPLLGTTWLFGLLSLSRDTLLFQYLFATTNSLQGFFLFVFHCLCNSEVRADFARRHNIKTSSHSGKSPPWFSGSFGLNVASGLRKFRDSISSEFASSSHGSSNSEHSVKGSSDAVTESPKDSKRKLSTIPDGDENITEPKIPRLRRTKTSKSLPAPSHKKSKEVKPTQREKTSLGHGENAAEITREELAAFSNVNTHDSGSNAAEATCDTVAKKTVCEEATEEKINQHVEMTGTTFKKTHLLPPLLSMPMKNDIIHITRTNKISPSPMTKHQQMALDNMLQHQLEQKSTEENKATGDARSESKSDINIADKIKPPKLAFSAEGAQNNEVVNRNTMTGSDHTGDNPSSDDEITGKGPQKPQKAIQLEDIVDEDGEKEAYKIPMSYDSGLNSIDNESLLEEEYYADEYVEMPYGRYKVGIHGCDVVI